uniref:CCHC-type domain-containing protein n=1 Tax=Cajanus cajan TaxID=3821 RepID=A0A151SZP6_CAJCA|nr:hypothetical protein KK1_015730 [Cajanus cajan]
MEEYDELVEKEENLLVDGDSNPDPCPTINVTQEEFEKWCSPWKKALIIHVLGKHIAFKALENKVNQNFIYNDHFLWGAQSKLGKMLKIDKLTSIHSRGKFARICMEVNLNRKLVSMINVMGHIIKLEYEGQHSICFKCGRYGHKQEHCGVSMEQ